MGGSTRFDSASLQQIRSRSLSDVHRLREHDAFHRRLKEAAKEGWMEGILRRLHVQPSVIKEAAAAVKLGLATPEALENVAKRASILALEAEDRTLGGGSKAAGAPKKVWQPFPSKQGDPANHALMWRKVPVTTLPTLQPLPGSSEAEHSNFRLLPGLHAHIEAQREPWVARACFRCDCDCPVVGVGLTHDHTYDQCFDCDCLLSGSAGKEFMQFDGGIYRVLNTTGDILPGAIELPTNGSNWQLQDINVLQGKEPDPAVSEIEEKQAEGPATTDGDREEQRAEAATSGEEKGGDVPLAKAVAVTEPQGKVTVEIEYVHKGPGVGVAPVHEQKLARAVKRVPAARQLRPNALTALQLKRTADAAAKGAQTKARQQQLALKWP